MRRCATPAASSAGFHSRERKLLMLICIVALPGQLFYSTQIPASLWFLDRDKANGHSQASTKTWRDRRDAVLFIDARRLGVMVDRTHRELTDDDIARIAGAYHAWR